jgi:hypothetical protein
LLSVDTSNECPSSCASRGSCCFTTAIARFGTDNVIGKFKEWASTASLLPTAEIPMASFKVLQLP